MVQEPEGERQATRDAPAGRSEIVAKPPSELDKATVTTLPFPAPVPKRRRWPRITLAVVAIALAAGGGAYYRWKQWQEAGTGIVASNGRIEADQININTKFAGRLAERLVDEGDMVHAGQIVARMDTKDLEASLKQAQAQGTAQRAIDEARSLQEQQKTQVELAQQQFDRTSYLFQRGNSTQELLDQRRQQLNGATAALHAATARVLQAENALTATQHQIELLSVNIADNSFIAPRDGRIQYRVANVGEVLPAGGTVLTMIDISSVYMDIYLPTLEAGRAKIGTDARIVLDAYPNCDSRQGVVHRNSVAVHAKTVETQTERERLMFRSGCASTRCCCRRMRRLCAPGFRA